MTSTSTSGRSRTAYGGAQGSSTSNSEPLLAGYDAVHGILLIASVVLGYLSIRFHGQRRSAEYASRHQAADLISKQRKLEDLVKKLNEQNLLQRPTSSHIEYRLPPEIDVAAVRLAKALQPTLRQVHMFRELLEPHARVLSKLSEFDSRIQAVQRVISAQANRDPTVGAMQVAETLLASPDLASEGFLRELLHDLLRAQRRKGGISLDDSRSLASSLAAGCGVEFFEPQIGQPFDKNLHQAVGDSTTSAFREPVVKRVVSGGLREPKSGHIGMRADVEVG